MPGLTLTRTAPIFAVATCKIHPFNTASGPHPDAIARANAQPPETRGGSIDFGLKLEIGQSQSLVTGNQGLPVRMSRHDVIEVRANQSFVEGNGWALGVTVHLLVRQLYTLACNLRSHGNRPLRGSPDFRSTRQSPRRACLTVARQFPRTLPGSSVQLTSRALLC